MNKADNDAGNAAIDSLLNYETVKVRYCHILHCYIMVTASSMYLLVKRTDYWLSPKSLSLL